MTIQEPTQLITGEELAQMGDIGSAELVRGEIVHHMPTGHTHGKIEMLLAILLGAFILKHKLGHLLGGETGVYTSRNPDSVRGMDVAYISNERYSRVKSKSYLDIAPELIIEIMSPDDRWSIIQEKIEEYFGINALEVWIVDPRTEQIHVYQSSTSSTIFNKSQTISGGSILPGFTLELAQVFES